MEVVGHKPAMEGDQSTPFLVTQPWSCMRANRVPIPCI